MFKSKKIFNVLKRDIKIHNINKNKSTTILTDNIPEKVLKNLGEHVFLNKEVCIYKDTVTIGDYTYINGGKIFYAKIGKFCSIGYNVFFGGGCTDLIVLLHIL